MRPEHYSVVYKSKYTQHCHYCSGHKVQGNILPPTRETDSCNMKYKLNCLHLGTNARCIIIGDSYLEEIRGQVFELKAHVLMVGL